VLYIVFTNVLVYFRRNGVVVFVYSYIVLKWYICQTKVMQCIHKLAYSITCCKTML